jgi:putative nucleotidyltransferase with HDIG domain
MKTGNRSLKANQLRKTNCVANNIQPNDKYYNCTIIGLLPLLSMLAVILPKISANSTKIQSAKHGIVPLLLTLLISIYLQMNPECIMYKKYAKSIITISYLGSLSLIFAVKRPDILCFWMAGGLIITMMLDRKLGLLVHVNLTLILQIVLYLSIETAVSFLIIGILINLLSDFLIQKETMAYACVILLSTNITLNFVINNYVTDKKSNYNYLSSMFSLFAILVIVYLLYLFYQWIIQKWFSTEIGDSVLQGVCLSKTGITALQCPSGSQISYELLNEPDNELLRQLKEYSMPLYKHSVFIGNISSRAAKIVGADEAVVMAGGLYHEIGKIRDIKNYIEESLKIAQEYQFPSKLKVVLRQHNSKYEKPTSVEAAIVMMTEYVASAIDCIDKLEDNKFTIDKIIDNLFLLSLNKGDFDDSGLSVRDFKRLKEFYTENFKNRQEY